MTDVLLIAGRIKGGKSSVSRTLAERLNASYVSFGDAVRAVAVTRGLDPGNRETLQELGQELVLDDAAGFVRAVLAQATPEIVPERVVVIDGVRHFDIWRVLVTSLAAYDCRLIYIDAPSEVRTTRASEIGVTARELARADAHANESDVVLLREKANLTVDATRSSGQAADEIIEWLRRSRG